jgi:hypothetical protein
MENGLFNICKEDFSNRWFNLDVTIFVNNQIHTYIQPISCSISTIRFHALRGYNHLVELLHYTLISDTRDPSLLRQRKVSSAARGTFRNFGLECFPPISVSHHDEHACSVG